MKELDGGVCPTNGEVIILVDRRLDSDMVEIVAVLRNRCCVEYGSVDHRRCEVSRIRVKRLTEEWVIMVRDEDRRKKMHR